MIYFSACCTITFDILGESTILFNVIMVLYIYIYVFLTYHYNPLIRHFILYLNQCLYHGLLHSLSKYLLLTWEGHHLCANTLT
jgi:hypothetical protein